MLTEQEAAALARIMLAGQTGFQMQYLQYVWPFVIENPMYTNSAEENVRNMRFPATHFSQLGTEVAFLHYWGGMSVVTMYTSAGPKVMGIIIRSGQHFFLAARKTVGHCMQVFKIEGTF